MLKLVNTTPSTIPADGTITLYQDFNSNQSMKYENNETKVLKSGYYKIDANINIEATATGDYSVALYNNGVIIPETTRTFTFTTVGNKKEFIINDAEKIVPTFLPQNATLTFKGSGGATLVDAEVIIFEIR